MSNYLGKHPRLSLGCKFKDSDTVELTVMDHEKGQLFQILWTFRNEEVITKTQDVQNETEEVSVVEGGADDDDENSDAQ